MLPFLTYPLALVALGALPALAAIYILRNRFRRRPVSSLILWRFQIQSKSGGAKIHRLQLPFLFFLEMLALLFLVVAATGPRLKLPQTARPLIVILDDSFSMQAVHDGASPQTRAREFLKKLFGQPPPSTRLILAGTDPRLLGSPVESWSEVDQALGQWKCQSAQSALDSAITLAAELGKEQANLLILTDHRPADEKISNPRLEWRAFGSAVGNCAFVNASRTAFGEQDRCLLEIANFSSEPRATKLTVAIGSNVSQSSLVSLGARGNQRLVFNIPASAPLLRATIEPDALAADNEVQLLPPIRQRVRVQVALTNQNLAALVNRTLDATGLRAAISAKPELLLQQTDAPVGGDAWSFYWPSLSATDAFVGPFIIDTSHPLAAGVSLDGVIWTGAATTNLMGGVPLILAGNTPLLSEREDELGRRHIAINFNPRLSTLQNTPDWPILFWNILHWRAAELPGLKESNARLGTEVNLKTDGKAVTIIAPDGEKRFFPKTGGDLALETPMPGLYSVVEDHATNQFTVNTLSADKSNLAGCGAGQWGAWSQEPERRLTETSAVWIFGLVALALLTTHLYLVGGAKGGTG